MSDLKDYEDLFEQFFNEFILFKTQKEQYRICPGCSSEKSFSLNEDKLIYACGPPSGAKTSGAKTSGDKTSGAKKCGPQFTIEMPVYVDYNQAKEQFLDIINGSSRACTDPLAYDLKALSKHLELTEEYGAQQEIVEKATKSLKELEEELIKANHLAERNSMIQELSQKRQKNSHKKSLTMLKLLSSDTPAVEKQTARRAYAQIIQDEHREIRPLMEELRKPIVEVVMTSKPKIIKNV